MKRLIILALLVPLAGCASMFRTVADAVDSPTYSQDYAVYVMAVQECMRSPQTMLPLAGGAQYPLPRDCDQVRPPSSSADARAAVIGGVLSAGSNLIGIGINAAADYGRAVQHRKSRESDNKVLEAAFGVAGPHIGGDGFVGDGSQGFTTVNELVEPEEPVDEEPVDEDPEEPEEPVEP